MSKRTASFVLIGMFLVAFFLRAYHPVSRPHQWHNRADYFLTAVREGNWADTYQTHHPGFTVMAIGAAGRALHNQTAGAFFAWAAPPYATDFGLSMTSGVVSLAFVIAGLIVGITLLLKRLAGWPVALAAGALLTLSPFHLAQSRVFHVDALLSTLMLTSALLLLLYLEEDRWQLLVASGVVGGFALLTKAPAVFLVPFTGLGLLVYVVRDLLGKPFNLREAVMAALQRIGLSLVIWLACAVLPFALWPAMWASPLGTLEQMWLGSQTMIEEAHPLPRFFLGQMYAGEPPGPFFYPVMIAFYTTAVSLPLMIVALVVYARHRQRSAMPALSVLLMAAYVVFFVIQMSLGAKQIFRYILPVDPAIAVMAGVGAVEALSMALNPKQRDRWLFAGLAVIVALQAVMVLPYFPDIGAFRNHMLGGNRAAINAVSLTGQNEGVIAVADYLASQGVQDDNVGVAYPLELSLQQYYSGPTPKDPDPNSTYYVLTHVAVQRWLEAGEWEQLWAEYDLAGREPLFTIAYDGVPYLWLFSTDRDAVVEPVVANRGGLWLVVLAWVWVIALFVATVRGVQRREELQPASSLL